MEQAAGMSEHQEKVWAAIDKGRLKKLGMDLVDIWSPTGEEEEIARFLGEHYESIGLASRLQEFEIPILVFLRRLHIVVRCDVNGHKFLFATDPTSTHSSWGPGPGWLRSEY